MTPLAKAMKARVEARWWARRGIAAYRRALAARSDEGRTLAFANACHCFCIAIVERELARDLTRIYEQHVGGMTLIALGRGKDLQQ